MTVMPSGRWDPYVLSSGDSLENLWEECVDEESRILLIMGKGFDPRMCDGLDFLHRIVSPEQLEVLLIDLDEGRGSPSRAYAEKVDENVGHVVEAVGEGRVQEEEIEMVTTGGRRVGDRRAADIVDSNIMSSGFTEIIVDTSAIPTIVYFPLLAKILYEYERAGEKGLCNIHVFVSENPRLDSLIVEEGVEDTADFVHGFRGQLETEATEDLPQIWFPLVGEKQEVQMERVYSRITPDEIAPIFPFPSGQPRRGDDLVYEYRERFFDSFRVPPQNVIYADESNPFQVYRKVRSAVEKYDTALQPLGGAASVISVLSSKLMALGGFLAAYELERREDIHVGVAHVESQGYSVVGEIEELPSDQGRLFDAWIAGVAYE